MIDASKGQVYFTYKTFCEQRVKKVDRINIAAEIQFTLDEQEYKSNCDNSDLKKAICHRRA